MDIQSSELNEVFVLYPIIIQGWVTPVKPDGIAHGGIPKLLYDGEPQGLECLVDPWSELRLFNSTMAVDDRVDLYVNDDITPAVGETIAPGEEQLRVRLYLPHGRLNHGVNRLYYKVTRAGGNIETSRDLRVLYHLRIAEGLDLVIPPDVLSDGVDAARAAQGVEFGFTYNNRRAYDRIEFRPGDTSILFDVPNAPAAVTQTLFTDAFQKAGDNPSAVAEFYVIDQLGNRSKSPEKRVDIHLSRLNLPAPTVKGQIGNNFSPTQPELRVLVPRGALLLSDLLSVIWQGATGIAASSYTSTPRLVSAGLEIAVPRSVLAYSLAKVVTVTYVIERNGVRSTSLPLKLNILALPATALNPPKIIEADANNFLDVIALGTKNATIHGLLWTLIEVGQQVWLKLEGKKANGTAHNLTIWNGSGHYVNGTWVAQGFWPRSLVNSYLKELGDGSTLTLKFKAALDKSNIEANAVVFPDRVYTIRAAALLSPTITSVKGSPGNVEIANGASTSDTTLVFSGKAAPGQQIELRDKGVVKATVAVDAADNWNHTLTGQAIGAHSYTAKAKYGTLPESAVRTLTIVANIAPTITSVKDPKNVEISHGGTTVETNLTLSGAASNGQQIEVFDGTTSKGKATVDALTGIWTLMVSGLAVAAHTFIAKALYGSGNTSQPRTVIVTSNFFVEVSDLFLRGGVTAPSLLGWTRKDGNPPGTSASRPASGGKPPYTYSSNSSNVTVDNTGTVKSVRNGMAIITVSDSSVPRQSKGYKVTVSGAMQLIYNPTPLTRAAAAAWIQSQGGNLIYQEHLKAINDNFDAKSIVDRSKQWSTGKLSNASGTAVIGTETFSVFFMGSHAAGYDIPTPVLGYI